jgi:hypothetical protein
MMCHEGFAELTFASHDTLPNEPLCEGAVAGVRKMKRAIIVLALIALSVPSKAAPRSKASDNGASLEEKCRKMAGKDVGEGEMKSHINRHVIQLWSDCMMGMPHAR